MAKYHINNNGDVGVCSANSGGCPFGDDSEHFDSKLEATAAAESALAEEYGVGSLRKSETQDLAQWLEHKTEATRKNTVIRRHLKKIPADLRRRITGGYLDIAASVDITKKLSNEVDRFSERSDASWAEMQNDVNALSGNLKKDQSDSEAYLAEAEIQKDDGLRNEYVLAAILSSYEGVNVYMPTGNAPDGGKPKADMIVEINGKQRRISIKKNNGTQIESYATRSTVSAIAPGANVVSAIEETSNRIFYFRPKYQAFAEKPGEKEKLRLLRDGTPKLAGAAVRIEYGEKSKLPKNRPTLPEESAVVAFGGIYQRKPLPIHDANRMPKGTAREGSAEILVVGDFSKISDLSEAPTIQEVLGESMPISRNGLRKRNYAVTLRVSSSGNRGGDWVTDRSHVGDNDSLSLRAYTAALKSATA